MNASNSVANGVKRIKIEQISNGADAISNDEMPVANNRRVEEELMVMNQKFGKKNGHC